MAIEVNRRYLVSRATSNIERRTPNAERRLNENRKSTPNRSTLNAQRPMGEETADPNEALRGSVGHMLSYRCWPERVVLPPQKKGF
jgi:hypothetical protein